LRSKDDEGIFCVARVSSRGTVDFDRWLLDIAGHVNLANYVDYRFRD
jgi:hypothetical protein